MDVRRVPDWLRENGINAVKQLEAILHSWCQLGGLKRSHANRLKVKLGPNPTEAQYELEFAKLKFEASIRGRARGRS